MIYETELLEALDWDESAVERVFALAADFVSTSSFKSMPALEAGLKNHLHDAVEFEITDHAVNLVIKILNENIAREMRIIEE
jgi:hypothetical protein